MDQNAKFHSARARRRAMLGESHVDAQTTDQNAVMG
jgi:hypothetical protein